MIKIIVTGHGQFASGIESSIQMLAGSNPHLYFVDFLADDSDKILKEQLLIILNENQDADFLIICDMAGGTPFNTSVRIASEKENIEVVAGTNLSSLLEILFTMNDYPVHELAEKVVEISQESTLLFEKNSNAIQADFEEEGI